MAGLSKADALPARQVVASPLSDTPCALCAHTPAVTWGWAYREKAHGKRHLVWLPLCSQCCTRLGRRSIYTGAG
jgi:hypothetical protein